MGSILPSKHSSCCDYRPPDPGSLGAFLIHLFSLGRTGHHRIPSCKTICVSSQQKLRNRLAHDYLVAEHTFDGRHIRASCLEYCGLLIKNSMLPPSREMHALSGRYVDLLILKDDSHVFFFIRFIVLLECLRFDSMHDILLIQCLLVYGHCDRLQA